MNDPITKNFETMNDLLVEADKQLESVHQMRSQFMANHEERCKMIDSLLQMAYES
jgi:cellobiose-specific phosphotransferase system component IIA